MYVRIRVLRVCTCGWVDGRVCECGWVGGCGCVDMWVGGSVGLMNSPALGKTVLTMLVRWPRSLRISLMLCGEEEICVCVCVCVCVRARV